jgi:hypothetical protein
VGPMRIRITATGRDAVARRLLSRRNFLAKGAQLLGAAIAVRALPRRNQVGLPFLPVLPKPSVHCASGCSPIGQRFQLAICTCCRRSGSSNPWDSSSSTVCPFRKASSCWGHNQSAAGWAWELFLAGEAIKTRQLQSLGFDPTLGIVLNVVYSESPQYCSPV